MSDSFRSTEVILKKMRIGLMQSVGKDFLDSLNIEEDNDFLTQRFIYSLKAYILGNTIHKEKSTTNVPLTWWDAFKETHYPEWLKKHFPIKYREIVIETNFIHVCPHSNLAPFKGSHIEFLMTPNQIKGFGDE